MVKKHPMKQFVNVMDLFVQRFPVARLQFFVLHVSFRLYFIFVRIPPSSTPGNAFDAKSVSLLCCPRGLSFTTDRIYSPSVSPKPQDKDSTFFHTFLVTREDGSRIYGTAFTFYEVLQTVRVV